MIIYNKLWDLMDKKNISQYSLIYDYDISSLIINKLKHNKNVNVSTIDRLCSILDCTPNDILEYIPDNKKGGSENVSSSSK